MTRPGLRYCLRRRRSSLICLAFVACLVGAGSSVWPGTADAGTVARGIADPLIISSMTADQQKEALHVIGSHEGKAQIAGKDA